MIDYTVILANGDFPSHKEPLKQLNHAARIVCCDGAIEKLYCYGKEPFAIVGDMDSISDSFKDKFKNIIHVVHDQEINDLTKTVRWCHQHEFNNLIILGATGKREDHTIGNISLLAKYNLFVQAEIYTDFGIFRVIYNDTTFNCFKDQQISIFTCNHDQRITSENLFYPLNNISLPMLWSGTLNKTISDSFTLHVTNNSPVIVYFCYKDILPH